MEASAKEAEGVKVALRGAEQQTEKLTSASAGERPRLSRALKGELILQERLGGIWRSSLGKVSVEIQRRRGCVHGRRTNLQNSGKVLVQKGVKRAEAGHGKDAQRFMGGKLK